MLIFDQLKKNDRKLQCVAVAVLASMGILLAGLWYVQVVRADRFRANLQDQSVRTVRLPAIRGKILDRNRFPLAENRPSYNVNLYLEELRNSFSYEYTNEVKKEFKAAHPDVALTRKIRDELERQARYRVVSNLLLRVSSAIAEPRLLVEADFQHHYDQLRSLPLPLLKDLSKPQVAMFVEKAGNIPSLALEPQAMRYYPHGTAAAHLLGYLQKSYYPVEDEDISFRFRLPDYVGVKGIEAAFDTPLRGKAGVKAVLVNSMAYRQAEDTPMSPEPGQNVVLTIDHWIQLGAEEALAKIGNDVRGAVVVMDSNTGDIYALVSSPAFDPNKFISGFTPEEWENSKMNDPDLRPMFNRATYGMYPPGSTFKIIVAMAALDAGALHPEEVYESKGYYQIRPGGHVWKDTAGSGPFDFRKAFYRSSNSYFIEHGRRVGAEKIVELARQFHLGEPTGVWPKLEAAGQLPAPGKLIKLDGAPWQEGDTCNLSIGQGEITVTPLQMAVLTAAVANGGTILQPRLVIQVEPQELSEGTKALQVPERQVRGTVKLDAKNLELVHQGMLEDVELVEGTGHQAAVPGLKIAGKTGTAQLMHGRKDYITWFVSYAPFENPRYAVVVVVEEGNSGGKTCAPVARDIYKAIVKRDPSVLGKVQSLAQASEPAYRPTPVELSESVGRASPSRRAAKLLSEAGLLGSAGTLRPTNFPLNSTAVASRPVASALAERRPGTQKE